MAIELLVRAVTTRPRPGQSFRSFWAQGEVVNVKQVPHSGWGRLEDPAQGATNFWIVTLEGINLDNIRVANLLERGLEDGNGAVSRRRYWLNVASFPDAQRTALRTTGKCTFASGELLQVDAAVVQRSQERSDNNEIEP